MKRVRTLATAWWIAALLLGVGACDCGDDDEDGGAGQSDDDASPDVDDDSASPDDDDDDASPDDDDDDDQSPGECPNGFLSPDGVCIERVNGRSPGVGTSAVVGANGVVDVAAIMGRELLLYEVDPAGDPTAPLVTKVDDMAAQPSLARDSAGHLRLVYLDLWTDRVKFAANDGAGWSIETISPAGQTVWYVAAALDADGRSHVAYMDGPNQTLVYATNAAGPWTSETLLTHGLGANSVAIAVGPQGEITIAAAASGLESARSSAEPKGEIVNIYLVSNASGDWTTESFDQSGSCPGLGVAIDGSGNLHLAFNLLGINSKLKYGSNASGAWALESLTADITWFAIALTVDANDAPHVIYSTANDVTVTMGVKQDGSWSYQNIDGQDFIGMSPAIALDDDGRARVSYASQTRLRLAAEGSGAWERWTIDEGTAVDNPTSLAVDADGVSHAVFTDAAALSLQYANNRSGAWAVEPIVGEMSGPGGLALDSDGRPNVATRLNDAIVRFVRDEDGWSSEVVDDGSHSIGGDVRLTIDANDGAHLIYLFYGEESIDLRYATNAAWDWAFETIASTTSLDWSPSYALAVDADAHAHVALLWDDPTIGAPKLRYATNRSGAWEVETVAPTWSAGSGCSIALDSAGAPHLAYHLHDDWDQPGQELCLAHSWLQEGAWASEIVDASRFAGTMTSLAIDGNDALHIADFQEGDNNLRYSTNASGQWASRVIDPAGWSGLYPSLALWGDEVRILYMADYSAYQARFARAGAAR